MSVLHRRRFLSLAATGFSRSGARRARCGKQPFAIISGYRTPETNAMLRGRSDGVASHSLHMDGKAIDIRVAGVPLNVLRRAAMGLRSGGVGCYPVSDFVHVDVGRVRAW